MLKPWEFENPNCKDVDTEIFYPDAYDKSQYTPSAMKMMRELCSTCPFKEPCLMWALKYEGHGVWAGTTEYDRRRLRKQYGVQFTTAEYFLA